MPVWRADVQRTLSRGVIITVVSRWVPLLVPVFAKQIMTSPTYNSLLRSNLYCVSTGGKRSQTITQESYTLCPYLQCVYSFSYPLVSWPFQHFARVHEVLAQPKREYYFPASVRFFRRPLLYFVFFPKIRKVTVHICHTSVQHC